jgi:hypothetical protein
MAAIRGTFMVAQVLARRFSPVDAQSGSAIVAAIILISAAGLGGAHEVPT